MVILVFNCRFLFSAEAILEMRRQIQFQIAFFFLLRRQFSKMRRQIQFQIALFFLLRRQFMKMRRQIQFLIALFFLRRRQFEMLRGHYFYSSIPILLQFNFNYFRTINKHAKYHEFKNVTKI